MSGPSTYRCSMGMGSEEKTGGSVLLFGFQNDGHLAVDGLLERNERFGGDDARNLLDAVVEQAHEVFVVVGIELDEHGVGAGGEVTLHDFRNLVQLLHGVAVHGAALQRDAHVGAGAVAQTLGIDVVAGPYDDARLDEALHALMDGRTRHAAYRGHVLKGNTRVTGNDFQYLLVQFVYFFHDVKLKCEFLDSSGFTFEKCVRVRIKQR